MGSLDISTSLWGGRKTTLTCVNNLAVISASPNFPLENLATKETTDGSWNRGPCDKAHWFLKPGYSPPN